MEARTGRSRYRTPDAKGFYDEMAFWNPQHGILVGDQIDEQIMVMTTEDGGQTWQRRKMPPAIPGEGAFAASGTGITVMGKQEAWIATGGKGAARVYHTKDAGKTWTVVGTPLRNDSANAGIFSLAFSDAKHGIAVGGDYSKATDETGNIAVTADGGKTWTKPAGDASQGVPLGSGLSGGPQDVDCGRTFGSGRVDRWRRELEAVRHGELQRAGFHFQQGWLGGGRAGTDRSLRTAIARG